MNEASSTLPLLLLAFIGLFTLFFWFFWLLPKIYRLLAWLLGR